MRQRKQMELDAFIKGTEQAKLMRKHAALARQQASTRSFQCVCAC